MNTANKGKILIVEDDTNSRSLLTDRFNQRGFQVDAYSTSEPALKKLSEEGYHPSVVLFNAHLPSDANARDFRAKLKISHPQAPLIMISDRGEGLESALELALQVAHLNETAILSDFPTLGELEKRYMRIVLDKTKGRKERAAKILGINRRTLYRKEREYGWVVGPEEPTDLANPPETSH